MVDGRSIQGPRRPVAASGCAVDPAGVHCRPAQQSLRRLSRPGRSGSAGRWSGPDAVRYMSVHSWKQPDSHGHSGTSPGTKQQPARPGKPSSRAISAGGGRCWVRTSVGEADGFTDRSLWPLGQPAWCRSQDGTVKDSGPPPACGTCMSPPELCPARPTGCRSGADACRAQRVGGQYRPVPRPRGQAGRGGRPGAGNRRRRRLREGEDGAALAEQRPTSGEPVRPPSDGRPSGTIG